MSLLDPEVVSRLKNMELRARLIVEGFITGLHKSPYHGFSVEFAEHRPYNAGDELRRLDWKVLAKTDRPYVKMFEEETNLRQHVILDTSASMRYKGTASVSKLEYGAYLAAALHLLMLRQRDAAGLMAFDERVHTAIRPSASMAHLRSLLVTLERLLEPPETDPVRTHAAAALAEIAERIGRRSLVVLISDLFEDAAAYDDVLRALRRLRHQGHEVLVFHVLDSATERHLAFDNVPVRFVDSETGEEMTLQPGQLQPAYTEAVARFSERFRRGCLEQHIDFVELDTGRPFAEALLAYLNKRRRVG